MNKEDNIHTSMMEQVEQLTCEKYSLEDILSSLRSQLRKAEEDNLSLKSRCDDLEKSLELEKRRVHWKESFHEECIQELTGLSMESTSVNEETPSNEGNAFYEDIIKALVTVQQANNKELDELKTVYEGKLIAQNLQHEAAISEILESSNIQVQKMIKENEGLIRDMMAGCEGLFDELKFEYTDKVRDNAELDTKSGENILVQYNGLSATIKGMVVAGIAVISVATVGWASWGFIKYVWPQLVRFAEMVLASPITSLKYLMNFLNSDPCQSFIKSWEEGKPLTECLKSFANVEFFISILRMAPTFFTEFKNFRAAVM